MPIDMGELYAQDPGAAQVEEGTGQAAPTDPTQTYEGEAAQADVTLADQQDQSAPAEQATAVGTGPAATATATGPEATAYDAVQRDVQREETAAGQLEDITGRQTPLMQRARQEGVLTAARRGLQNTSIAAGTAQGAMVDRATPIALQDAQTYAQAASQNQAAVNRAREVSTGRETDVSVVGAQLYTQTDQFNAAQANDLASLNAELGTRTSMFNATEANNIRKWAGELEQNAELFNAQQANQIAALNAELETQMEARNTAAKNEGSFLDSQLRAQLNDANAARELALAQGNMQEWNRQTQFIMDLNADLNKQFLAGEQAMDLAHIQGRYNQLISTNESAARLFDSYFSSISNAMANDKITPDRIAGYINVLQRQLESGLNMMDAMNEIEGIEDVQIPGATGTGSGGGATIRPVEPPAGGGEGGTWTPPPNWNLPWMTPGLQF